MRLSPTVTVAHCIAVSDNAIRVQLPGGEIYAPALAEAASKTGARSSLSKAKVKTLTDLVTSGVGVLNSGGSSMITLEMQVHEETIVASLVGKGCRGATKKLVKELEALADKKARSFETAKSAAGQVLRFEV